MIRPRVRRQLLAGDVPSPTRPPQACRFHTRCWKCQEVCTVEEPLLDTKTGGNLAACHFPLSDDEARRERIVLRGEVPSPIDPPSGCRFHPRCRYATEICSVEEPVLADHGGGRFAACHHPLDAKGA